MSAHALRPTISWRQLAEMTAFGLAVCVVLAVLLLSYI
jgi:hypothetical protein